MKLTIDKLFINVKYISKKKSMMLGKIISGIIIIILIFLIAFCLQSVWVSNATIRWRAIDLNPSKEESNTDS